jgi:hypothetical protein
VGGQRCRAFSLAFSVSMFLSFRLLARARKNIPPQNPRHQPDETAAGFSCLVSLLLRRLSPLTNKRRDNQLPFSTLL